MNELTPEQLQQLAQLMRQERQTDPSMMGFDQNQWTQMMSDPAAREAGAELAGLASEQAALQLQQMGRNQPVPNGGRLGWTEALDRGLTKGLGVYQMLNAQRAKADAIRNWGKKQQGGLPVEVMEVDITTPEMRSLPPIN